VRKERGRTYVQEAKGQRKQAPFSMKEAIVIRRRGAQEMREEGRKDEKTNSSQKGVLGTAKG